MLRLQLLIGRFLRRKRLVRSGCWESTAAVRTAAAAVWFRRVETTQRDGACTNARAFPGYVENQLKNFARRRAAARGEILMHVTLVGGERKCTYAWGRCYPSIILLKFMGCTYPSII